LTSEDDPLVTVEYWDNTWNVITGYAKSFTIRDAGILNVPTADIQFDEPGGIR